jgi:hypothetical protein
MRIRKTSLLFGLSCLIVFGCIVLLLGKNKNLAGDDQVSVCLTDHITPFGFIYKFFFYTE